MNFKYVKTIIENKHVQVDGIDYRLTIEKWLKSKTYKAYLSALDSQFTNEFTFNSISSLESNLEYWIVQQHMSNNPENVLFKRLEQWDGVIHT